LREWNSHEFFIYAAIQESDKYLNNRGVILMRFLKFFCYSSFWIFFPLFFGGTLVGLFEPALAESKTFGDTA